MKLWISHGWAILAHQLRREHAVRSGNIVDLWAIADYLPAPYNKQKLIKRFANCHDRWY
jgi:hypothetical protein